MAVGLLVKIDGVVDRDALEWAVRRVVREVEPGRASFEETDGRVVQRVLEDPEVDLAFWDLIDSNDALDDVHRIAASIQCAPMPLSGPLFKFALLQTRPDQYYLFACCHHIVIDGFALGLAGQRIASVYSAVVSGSPVPPALFGSLQDLVDLESEYEASDDYLDDQAYWARNLPSGSESNLRSPEAASEPEPYWPSAPHSLDPALLHRVQEFSSALNVPRSSILTAACALLVRSWFAETSEVVLDFPVSRRVQPESKTLPGMFAGVIPLVLKVAPEFSVADFCGHVDTRIRGKLHQRFPVHSRAKSSDRRFRPGSRPGGRELPPVVDHLLVRGVRRLRRRIQTPVRWAASV